LLGPQFVDDVVEGLEVRVVRAVRPSGLEFPHGCRTRVVPLSRLLQNLFRDGTPLRHRSRGHAHRVGTPCRLQAKPLQHRLQVGGLGRCGAVRRPQVLAFTRNGHFPTPLPLRGPVPGRPLRRHCLLIGRPTEHPIAGDRLGRRLEKVLPALFHHAPSSHIALHSKGMQRENGEHRRKFREERMQRVGIHPVEAT
jgi:hypothetical protein